MKRGLLLTRPFSITSNSIRPSAGHNIDPLAIRFALLYLDEICIAKTKFAGFDLPPDLEILKQEKIITEIRSEHLPRRIENVQQIMIDSYKDCYDKLISKNKSDTWMLDRSIKNVLNTQSQLSETGELLTFIHSLPLPDEKFPIGDLLEFRNKREDERLALLNAIEMLRVDAIGSENVELATRKGLLTIEKALIDILKTLKESKKGFYLTNFSLDFSSQDFFETFKKAYSESKNFHFNELSSLLAAFGVSVATMFNVKMGYNYKKSRPDSPFLYAAEVKRKYKL